MFLLLFNIKTLTFYKSWKKFLISMYRNTLKCSAIMMIYFFFILSVARLSCKDFSCDDGSCLNLTQVCDGKADCAHNEDEVLCSITVYIDVFFISILYSSHFVYLFFCLLNQNINYIEDKCFKGSLVFFKNIIYHKIICKLTFYLIPKNKPSAVHNI